MDARSSFLSVAVCQLTSSDDIAENVGVIETLIRGLKTPSEIDLICFPENAIYLRMNRDQAPPQMTLADPHLCRLQALAKELGTNLHLGSVPLIENGKLFSASVLMTSAGESRVLYKKIHLFDVDVEGAKPQRESETFAPGVESSTFSIKGWVFGSSICYDVRFAELYTTYAKAGVDVILIPSAFLVETGRAHWEILIRARAIESQVFVLAAAQGGLHKGSGGVSRSTYGHSMVVDPWGEILAEVKEPGAQVLMTKLVAGKIDSVRKQIPMASHRRLS